VTDIQRTPTSPSPPAACSLRNASEAGLGGDRAQRRANGRTRRSLCQPRARRKHEWGQANDAVTGLVRFGARDYDAETGRWTNRDPIGFAGQQGNQYLYVEGDAVNGFDPDGEHPVILAIAAGLGVFLATSDREAYTAAAGAVVGAFIGPALGFFGRSVSPAAKELVHLTGAGGEISESGLLLGRNGIYATSRAVADKTGVALTVRTGLTAAKATSAIPIPSTAVGAFSRPLPVGIITAWQRLNGTQCTAAGYIDLASGTFVRAGVNWNQVLLYELDLGIDAVAAGGITYAQD
jgi:RHS repeat-associated protein